MSAATQLREATEAIACSVEGCGKARYRRDLCGMHYRRLLVEGSVGEAGERCAPNGKGRHVGALGYMVVQCGTDHPLADSTGRVYEHRFVAWEAGLLTDPTHVVHHRNGDKQDNRLENLEVLTRSEHIKEHGAELRLARWGTVA